MEPGFWQNQKLSQSVMSEIKLLKNRLETWNNLKSQIQSLEDVFAITIEEHEVSLEPEIQTTYATLKEAFEKAVTLELMTGEA
ncbi:MAG: peptide chain release factor 2, partial [Spirochaetes bacterium]|nr:peptide chain release factor 2 [Spirochaetota bacterium]